MFIPLVVVSLGILWPALVFARNSRECVANMLLGFVGAIIALGIFFDRSHAKWLEHYESELAAVTGGVGAAVGVFLSIALRGDYRVFAVVLRGDDCSQAVARQSANHMALSNEDDEERFDRPSP
jgi:hypothetical protein